MLAAVAAAIGVGALLIRLILHERSFDLFGDEVIYAGIGRSVVDGGFPSFLGEPFFLHGPAFFYLEAGWSWIFGRPASLMACVYEMRTLNCLLAGLTAVLLVLLAAKVSRSLTAGTAAGLLFALDPFSIRQNDRVLLETAMMFWILLGYQLLLSLADRPLSRTSAIRAASAGLMFGTGILVKDEAALITILPMLCVVTFRWGFSRLLIGCAITASVVPYAVYVAVVAEHGYGPGWWSAKTTGIRRLLGVVQTTGFHSSGGGSLSGRLVSEGGNFATTYVLLLAAVPAAWIMLRHGSARPRVVALFYCASALTLAYAVSLGTLEEQELYLLSVPSMIVIPAGVTLFLRRRAAQGRTSAVAMAGVLAALLTLNLITSIQWLQQPDDGFSYLLPYLAKYAPAGTVIDLAAGAPPPGQTDGGRYALEGTYSVGLWTTKSALAQNHVGYILAEWGPINEGYAFMSQSAVRALVSGTRIVFSHDGRTYGQLALYKVASR
jgi:hypothetical protein